MEHLHLKPRPKIVVALEFHQQVGHDRVPLGQLADDPGTLRARRERVSE
jgi:hypothetical protein